MFARECCASALLDKQIPGSLMRRGTFCLICSCLGVHLGDLLYELSLCIEGLHQVSDGVLHYVLCQSEGGHPSRSLKLYKSMFDFL